MFDKIVEDKTKELEVLKQEASTEKNVILYYSLENAIYNLSLISGYSCLSKNYKYNAADTIIRTIYETLFQNIFIFTVLKNNKESDIEKLVLILETVNKLIKKSNRNKLIFPEIWNKYRTLEYKENHKVMEYMHKIRKKIRRKIENNDPNLPSLDSVNYNELLKKFDEKSDSAVHNTIFINSINENKQFNNMDELAEINIRFFLRLNLFCVRDILGIFGKRFDAGISKK